MSLSVHKQFRPSITWPICSCIFSAKASEAYDDAYKVDAPAEQLKDNLILARVKDGDRQNRTYAQLIAAAQIRKAMRGNTIAGKEIADRTEGKARQAVEVTVETPLEFHVQVNFVDSDGKVHPTPLGDLVE